MTARPLVSCLTVTRGRPELLRQAIACFAWQSYRPRELVIVTEEDAAPAVGSVATAAAVDGVRVVVAPPSVRTLGGLRNVGLETARGELVAQWDDDDLYHPCRVAAQVTALGSDAVACYLTEQLQYFAASRELYLTDWRWRGQPTLLEPVPDCIPGTAVFRRALGLRYPELRTKEDTVMLEQIHLRGEVIRLSGAAHLYMYRHHGGNTWSESHWRQITRWAAGSRELHRRRLSIVLSVQHFAPFLGEQPVTVRNNSGRTVYSLAPAERPVRSPAVAAGAAADVACAAGAPVLESPLRLTIAVATWNRADILREMLLSLAAIHVPERVDVEVLVCDNGSTDMTSEVVSAATAVLPARYLREDRQGKSHALIRLLGEAQGDWVVFLDDDVLVDPRLLFAYVDGIGRYPLAACFGGQVRPWFDEPPRGLRATLLRRYPWMHAVVEFDRDETIDPKAFRFVHGPNLAVRRAAVRLPDDIDTRRGMFGTLRISGEDLALVERVMEKGHEGWRLAGAVVHHLVPRTRSGGGWFLHRHFGEARSRAVSKGLAPGSFRYRRWLVGSVARELVRPLGLRYDRAQWALRRWIGSALRNSRRNTRRTSS